jgi:hypothetical protein
MFLKIFVSIFFLSQAFEQVKRSPGPIFRSTGDIDIGKIQSSKYFQALLKPSKEKDCNQLVDILQLIELYYFWLLKILEIMIFGYTYIVFVFSG